MLGGALAIWQSLLHKITATIGAIEFPGHARPMHQLLQDCKTPTYGVLKAEIDAVTHNRSICRAVMHAVFRNHLPVHASESVRAAAHHLHDEASTPPLRHQARTRHLQLSPRLDLRLASLSGCKYLQAPLAHRQPLPIIIINGPKTPPCSAGPIIECNIRIGPLLMSSTVGSTARCSLNKPRSLQMYK